MEGDFVQPFTSTALKNFVRFERAVGKLLACEICSFVAVSSLANLRGSSVGLTVSAGPNVVALSLLVNR